MNAHSTDQLTLDELLAGMKTTDKYDYLKIILTKNANRTIPQEYLLVSRTGFQVIRLLDIDFGNNGIIMILQDVQSGMTKKITIEAEDQRFKFLLISWQDIQQMVMEANSYSKLEDDELLDFDFS